MSGLSIQEHMIELKLAKNVFQASHMATGLKLWELKTVEEQIERVKLYRLWRDAGEPSKVAYVNAIEGKQPMELLEVE